MIELGHNWDKNFENDYFLYDFVYLAIFERKPWNVVIYDIFHIS